MIFKKYIVIMPSICVDGVYLAETKGVLTPDYYDSEQGAWEEIKDYNKYFDAGEEHFPMLVIVDTIAESLTDEFGFDWAPNVRLQASNVRMFNI